MEGGADTPHDGFSHGFTICNAMGARLCTVGELLSDETVRKRHGAAAGGPATCGPPSSFAKPPRHLRQAFASYLANGSMRSAAPCIECCGGARHRGLGRLLGARRFMPCGPWRA